MQNEKCKMKGSFAIYIFHFALNNGFDERKEFPAVVFH